MTAKHTPGPWDIGYAQADDIVIVVAQDRESEICTVWSDPDACDARLIAAAPELLEQLESLVALYEAKAEEFFDEVVVAQVKFVINKAKGVKND